MTPNLIGIISYKKIGVRQYEVSLDLDIDSMSEYVLVHKDLIRND